MTPTQRALAREDMTSFLTSEGINPKSLTFVDAMIALWASLGSGENERKKGIDVV